MSGFLDCPTCRTTSGVAGCPVHGGYWGMPRPDPHDHDAAQAAWVLRETDHDDRAAFMAGWDAAAGEVERLREVAEIVRRHTHQGLYAMTLHAGPNPEKDCHLCRALVAAGVLTLDEIGAGTRAALGEGAGR